MADGSDFGELGLRAGTGWTGAYSYYFYELRNNNSIVLTGLFEGYPSYIGFSGGVFDELRMVNSITNSVNYIGDNSFQALAIDSIEVNAVPEPSSILLFISGLAMIIGFRKKLSR